jgi:Ricin-type beta-trefoil lectin domain
MRDRPFGIVLVGTVALAAGSLPAAAQMAHPLAARSAITRASPVRYSAVAATAAAKTLYAFNSGLAMSVGTTRRPGAAVRIRAAAPARGRRWLIRADGTIRPAYDARLCLNVPHARYRKGTQLSVSACDGRARERFSIKAPSAHTEVFTISPSASRTHCLDIPAGFRSGNAVSLGSCNGVATQAWSTTNLSGTADLIFTPTDFIAAARQGGPGTPVVVSPAGSTLDTYWEASSSPGSVYSILRPVYDTSLCLAVPGEQKTGTQLALAACDGSAGQDFIGVTWNVSTTLSGYFITTTDGSFCLVTAAGKARVRGLVLGACAGQLAATWATPLNLLTSASQRYEQIFADAPGLLSLAMNVDAKGRVLIGSSISPIQMWTDVAPGSSAPGNPDGSIDIRPLTDQGLCLTVPNSNFAVGTQLVVQPCAGLLDQEFLDVSTGGGRREFMPFSAGSVCLSAGSFVRGSPVTLRQCDNAPQQAWTAYFFGWNGWGGLPRLIRSVSQPGREITLAAISATEAQAIIAPPDPATSSRQLWTQPQGSDGVTIHPVYDTAWCLDATTGSAGTQLIAQGCTGGATQAFLDLAVPDSDDSQYQSVAFPGECLTAGPASASGQPLLLEPCVLLLASQSWLSG